MNVTPEKIRTIIESHIESDLPDTTLEVLKREDGKQLTKRLLAKLPGGEEVWRIAHVATMTHLETWEYCRSQGSRGISLLIAYETKNVRIDASWIEQHNIAYFSARKERNEKRAKALESTEALVMAAQLVNAIRVAREQLAAAEETLSDLDLPEQRAINELTKLEGES
jgi:hypothetical protein